MIPKIIHYCWFGGNPMPARKCAASWKRLLPDWEFKLWNEETFDIDTVPFTRQVADAKKWGFIVDYIRAWAVYYYGGVYLDTDVELLRPLDDLLGNVCFVGFEGEYHPNPGSAFGGEKGCVAAKEIMDFYANYNFINNDGSLNLTPSPLILSQILLKHGFQQHNSYQKLSNITIYPSEYFCPKISGVVHITENTHCIHHYAGSWTPMPTRVYVKARNMSIKLFGYKAGKLLAAPLFIITKLLTDGISGVKKAVETKRAHGKETLL